VQDEFEHEEQPVTQLDDATFQIDASLNIDDLPPVIRDILPKEDQDYDTIGGFVLSTLGTIPKKGKRFIYKNVEITINDVKRRRIVSLIVKILEQSDTE
jgi:putative hemolysin